MKKMQVLRHQVTWLKSRTHRLLRCQRCRCPSRRNRIRGRCSSPEPGEGTWSSDLRDDQDSASVASSSSGVSHPAKDREGMLLVSDGFVKSSFPELFVLD